MEIAKNIQLLKKLVNLKGEKKMKYITDKSKIKNGMFVATQDDVVFVRIGGRLSKIDLNYFYSFDGLKQEEIKTIFKSNGKALLEKETETH